MPEVKKYGILAIPDDIIRADLGRDTLATEPQPKGPFGDLVSNYINSPDGTAARTTARDRLTQRVGALIDGKRAKQGVSMIVELVEAAVKASTRRDRI